MLPFSYCFLSGKSKTLLKPSVVLHLALSDSGSLARGFGANTIKGKDFGAGGVGAGVCSHDTLPRPIPFLQK